MNVSLFVKQSKTPAPNPFRSKTHTENSAKKAFLKNVKKINHKCASGFIVKQLNIYIPQQQQINIHTNIQNALTKKRKQRS